MVKAARWMDAFSLLFSVAIVVGSVLLLVRSGTLSTSLAQDWNPTWHLIRAMGVTAYILVTISVLWGLALSSRVFRDWSPGVLSVLLHTTVSWLGVVFGLGHGLLLMMDNYFRYHLTDVLIPFTGPYRPLAVGLGTLTFWIALVVSLSFAVKKRLGHRAWKTLHLSSYGAFVMATAHGLLAGTDASRPGFRLLLLASVVLVTGLLAYRVMAAKASGTAREPAAARPPFAAPPARASSSRTARPARPEAPRAKVPRMPSR